MDTEAFILARAEICSRLEERRLIERPQETFHWTQMVGNSFLTSLKLALQMGGGRSVMSWLPKTLLSVGAPMVFGLLRKTGLPFLGKKSIFDRFSSFIPFLKSL